MDVLCTSQASQAESLTAGIIAQALRAKPQLVLGLATGRTMKRVYAHLVCLHRQDGLDFSHCRTFNLDEYIGLPADHPGSYRRYMEEHLFRHINIRTGRSHVPDGMTTDVMGECQKYEALIQDAGGIDLQLLGLGMTGHIGFNEPGSPLDSRTHEVRLTDLTRRENAGPFGGKASAVPVTAITMGLETILEARRCLLLVTGVGKASVLARVVEGPVTPTIPGSVLQRHPDCKVVTDAAASRDLGMDPQDRPACP
jgi:glucosamine-6-phosphate deaminase